MPINATETKRNDLHGQVRVFPDMEELSHAAAERFFTLAAEAERSLGRCTVALSGGNTPRYLFRTLAAEYRDRLLWDKMHFYWGDERFVSAENPESNYRMARETLLNNIPIPSGNIHPMPTDVGDPGEAADIYEEILRLEFPNREPKFDIMLLGIGAEGHTASLFPGSPALREEKKWVVAVHAPAEPPERLTLTLPVINASRTIMVLVSGSDKREILKTIITGPADENIPASLVHPKGTMEWFVDKKAGELL